MNRLPSAQRAQILSLLCRGASLRGITRATGVSINTVTKLLVDGGACCESINRSRTRGLEVETLHCYRVWTPIATPGVNVAVGHAAGVAAGAWTWAAIDIHSGLIVAYRVGRHDTATAQQFLLDLQSRIRGASQALAGRLPRDVIERSGPFSMRVAAGRLTLTPENHGGATRFEVADRMLSRRFTRLQNSYVKKLENLSHMIALYVTWYNYVRASRGGVAPAVAAGLVAKRWAVENLVRMMDGHPM